ncbi:MAG TPA: hypothetical protein VGR89_14590, partial [Puia sp.]|nr:hypothetical protein [Puia sp.]
MTRYAVLYLIMLSGCRSADRQMPAAGQATPAAARTRVNYAKGFTIAYYDGYKEVKIPDHAAGAKDTLDYLLLAPGAAIPPGHPHGEVIRIPVQSLVAMGSPQVAEAAFAGVADRITGVG